MDLTIPLDRDAKLVIDPYPLADSVNFNLHKGDVPIKAAESWLSRELRADVKLESYHHGDRFGVWIDGQRQRDLVTVKVHAVARRPRRASEVREARRRRSPNVEFAVDDSQGYERVFKTFDEAAGFALSMGISGQSPVNLDVLIWSEKGALWYGGSDAVERYREDPEASVFERFKIKVNNVGMVP
jgi:hypothetical protein